MDNIILSRQELLDALTMADKDIGEFASTWEVPSDFFGNLIDRVTEAANEEPEVFKTLTPLDKMQYMSKEAYKQGVLMALYLSNEVVKEGIERLTKEKAQTEEAAATTKVTAC